MADLKIGIVVIGYNRTDSISRLLTRLNDCIYPSNDISLVVSLDNCGKSDVFENAERFVWKHGTKQVILQPERLGLRKHVLKCGTYMTEFNWDAQIVLEDDVYPSVAYYEYSMQAVAKYQNDDRIAGISLFALNRNQAANYPFVPSFSTYDAYFMQLAQSCGQVWMRKQWADFIKWYNSLDDTYVPNDNIPFNVRRWPERSWLKYHISYCIENNKWFPYPYQSLTTNFSEVGSNTGVKSKTLQTHLQNEPKKEYNLPDLNDKTAYYDAWCENLDLPGILELNPKDLCIDIYGAKGNYQNKRYWLTMLSEPYKVIRSYGMELMPMDMNVICNLPGKEIFLYDTSVQSEAPHVVDRDLSMWSFFNRIPYPDPVIMKLSRPMYKKIWKNRFSLIWHPKKLVKKIWNRIH